MQRKVLACLFALWGVVGTVKAQQAPMNAAERQRESAERQRRQEQVDAEIARQRARDAAQVPAEESKAAPVADGPSFQIDEIELLNDDWSGAARLPVLEKYRHTKMGPAEIFALVRALTEHYTGRGYVTTAVTVPPQNMRSGKLVLEVNWGKVAAVRLNGRPPEGWRERAAVKAALPGIEGKLLNIRDIDQLLENLTTSGKVARLAIQAAERDGYSYVDVNFEPGQSVTAAANFDNSNHYEADARGKLGVQLGTSDLLGINDSLNLSLGRGLYRTQADNRQQNWGMNYSVPFGYWSVAASLSRFSYGRALFTGAGRYESTGNTREQRLRLGYVLARSRAAKTNTWLDIARKENENFFSGIRLDVSSKLYTTLEWGVSHTDALWGGVAYGDLALVRGVRWLGGDAGTGDANAPQALYSKVKGTAQWQRDLAGPGLRYTGRLIGQHTRDQLLNAARFAMGDEYTVRGFEGTPVMGDQGLLWSNSLSMQRGCPVLEPVFGVCSATLGLDLGTARNRDTAVKWASWQHLAGASLGTRLAGKHTEIALTAGWPLRAPQSVARGPVFYVTASTRW